MRRKIAQVTTTVVLIDAVVSILHGLAHAKIPVPLSSLQQLFINIVIVAAPAIALLLLWTPLQRWGASLLLGSMTGALIFGIYNHFIAISPDRVSQIPLREWGWLFQITALLLVVTESLGCAVALWALRMNHNQAIVKGSIE
jgi:hypothetical protein